MNRYRIQGVVGDGAYGLVMKATHGDHGDVVAVKRMKRKFYNWQECMELREIKSLKKLSHQNIVKLKEVIRENDELFFVFEYLENNLFQLMSNTQQGFPESAVRCVMGQIFQALAYMHKVWGGCEGGSICLFVSLCVACVVVVFFSGVTK